jgi:pyruvate dehydrogenase E2 component (dihydrolipoamide acetyltransferase)
MKIPYLETGARARVVEVLVDAGVFVKVGDPLFAVESDKATYDVLSVHSGKIRAITVAAGDEVSSNSEEFVLYDTLPEDGEELTVGAFAPVRTSSLQAGISASGDYAGTPDENKGQRAAILCHLTPSQRKCVRLTGDTSFATAPPSDDIMAGLNLAPWPAVDFAKYGAIDTRPRSRIKKIAGANLHRNWVMIPHVTNNDEADVTDLEALRVQLNKENEKAGVKITMLAFVIKAMVSALKQFPMFNASLDGENLVFKHYFHIGFAADTPNGLVVPVIRDADKKGLVEIAKEMTDLSNAAREGKLKPNQMQGGSLSISSLGGIGGMNFTPLINAPEVAILGLSRGAIKPVWDGKQFMPRLMLPLSLSYDHRVIDGADAARFNAYLSSLLADFRRVNL